MFADSTSRLESLAEISGPSSAFLEPLPPPPIVNLSQLGTGYFKIPSFCNWHALSSQNEWSITDLYTPLDGQLQADYLHQDDDAWLKYPDSVVYRRQTPHLVELKGT
jgi:hypothetical protein